MLRKLDNNIILLGKSSKHTEKHIWRDSLLQTPLLPNRFFTLACLPPAVPPPRLQLVATSNEIKGENSKCKRLSVASAIYLNSSLFLAAHTSSLSKQWLRWPCMEVTKCHKCNDNEPNRDKCCGQRSQLHVHLRSAAFKITLNAESWAL